MIRNQIVIRFDFCLGMLLYYGILTAGYVQEAGLLVQGEEGKVHGAGAGEGDADAVEHGAVREDTHVQVGLRR